jgi:predicted Zn-dependent protease
MSGGYFDYVQDRMLRAADRLASLIETDDQYSKETLAEFGKALTMLRASAIYLQRIDWLISGDDSEETFHKRLKEELLCIPKENSND